MKSDPDFAPFLDTETVMDPLYGLIGISPFEKQIINTPEFQRLRGIKQLGFVNLVYPTAEHSRFVHSIGVCHIAKKLVDQINKNIEGDKRYRLWRKKGFDNLDYVKKNKIEFSIADKITAIERIVIAAAGLLHDLPHAPFSHEIESPNKKEKTGILKHDDFANNPVLFKYLFDQDFSELAKLLTIYNTMFFELLEKAIDVNDEYPDKKWRLDEHNWYKVTAENGGYIPTQSGELDHPITGIEGSKYKELPLLAVMIFEVLLFEKPQMWINDEEPQKENKIIGAEPIRVCVDWASNPEHTLKWRPLYGWFRPYRHDIIGNTICADLIDYIERDGRHTGIISSLDLKFLDRMTITRVPFYSDEKPIDINVKWEDIPETCEHIIFDVYDHKRGFVRESVITEILSCLQARYQLAERVYEHRVVEGARSMLQEISRLLCSVGVLKTKFLHANQSAGDLSLSPNPPISDETFLSWVIALEKNVRSDQIIFDTEETANIKKAVSLARCIRQRRVYREALVFDGLNGNHGSSGNEDACKALANVLISNEDVAHELERWILEMSSKAKEFYKGEELLPDILITLGIRKWGKRYKVPLVLGAQPFPRPELKSSNGHADNRPLDVQPLFAREFPLHIRARLESMQDAYKGLWKVYLFLHPVFHSKEFEDLHKYVSDQFTLFVKQHTPVAWINSIDTEQLLPEQPLDCKEFIRDYKRKATLERFYFELFTKGMSFLSKEPEKVYRRPTSKEINRLREEFESDPRAVNFLKHSKNQMFIINNFQDEKAAARVATASDQKKLDELISIIKKRFPKKYKGGYNDKQPDLFGG